MIEPHIIGQVLNDKIILSLTQEGENLYKLIAAINDEEDYSELFECSREEVFKKYRAKQFEYFNRIIDEEELIE